MTTLPSASASEGVPFMVVMSSSTKVQEESSSSSPPQKPTIKVGRAPKKDWFGLTVLLLLSTATAALIVCLVRCVHDKHLHRHSHITYDDDMEYTFVRAASNTGSSSEIIPLPPPSPSLRSRHSPSSPQEEEKSNNMVHCVSWNQTSRLVPLEDYWRAGMSTHDQQQHQQQAEDKNNMRHDDERCFHHLVPKNVTILAAGMTWKRQAILFRWMKLYRMAGMTTCHHDNPYKCHHHHHLSDHHYYDDDPHHDDDDDDNTHHHNNTDDNEDEEWLVSPASITREHLLGQGRHSLPTAMEYELFTLPNRTGSSSVNMQRENNIGPSSSITTTTMLRRDEVMQHAEDDDDDEDGDQYEQEEIVMVDVTSNYHHVPDSKYRDISTKTHTLLKADANMKDSTTAPPPPHHENDNSDVQNPKRSGIQSHLKTRQPIQQGNVGGGSIGRESSPNRDHPRYGTRGHSGAFHHQHPTNDENTNSLRTNPQAGETATDDSKADHLRTKKEGSVNFHKPSNDHKNKPNKEQHKQNRPLTRGTVKQPGRGSRANANDDNKKKKTKKTQPGDDQHTANEEGRSSQHGPDQNHSSLPSGVGPILPKSVLVIQDPIDRFVSNFAERSNSYCRSDLTETRQKRMSWPNDKDAHADIQEHPDKYCDNRQTTERAILHDIYHSDINNLAEAMCPTNDAPPGRVKKHLEHISPLKYGLVDWIHAIFGINPQFSSSSSSSIWNGAEIMALVMDDATNLKTLGDSSVLSLFQQLVVTEMGQPRQDIERIFKDRTPELVQDDGFSSLPTVAPGYAISPLGQCCLTRHLAQDYDLLRIMANSDWDKDPHDTANHSYQYRLVSEACGWGTRQNRTQCRDRLLSISNRGERYLRDLSIPCSQVVVT